MNPPSQMSAAAVLGGPGAAAPSAPIAHRVRLEREHSFLLPLLPAECFAFFEPLGEKAWAEDWQPVFASPVDVALHDGTVFTVERPHPDGISRLASIWTVTHYAPPQRIEYRNVLPGLRATRIDVRCEPAPPATTRVHVRYVYTSLSPEGDAALAGLSEAAFRQSIEGWGQAIGDYLRRGTPASP